MKKSDQIELSGLQKKLRLVNLAPFVTQNMQLKTNERHQALKEIVKEINRLIELEKIKAIDDKIELEKSKIFKGMFKN